MARSDAGSPRRPTSRRSLPVVVLAVLSVLLLAPVAAGSVPRRAIGAIGAIGASGARAGRASLVRSARELVSTPAGSAVPSSAAPGPVESPLAAAGLVPIAPSRVLDTRPGEAALVNLGAPIAPRATIVVGVVQPLGVVPAEIAGVALNVTVDRPTGRGFLTVWPDGERPVASTLNFVPGQTVPNGLVVGVDVAGQVRIHNGSDGTVHVIVDVNGWIPAGAGFTAIAPARALETRVGEPGYVGTRALGPDGRVTVDIASLLPAADRATVTAVAVNLTATNITADTYLTAYPAGSAQPGTSAVNARRGDTVPNSAVVGLSADGRLVVYNHAGSVDVVLDVTGYFVRGRTFKPLAPQRLLDTRGSAGAALGPAEAGFLKIDKLAALPRGFVGAVAVNVTVASATGSGFLTVWPSSSTRPTASSVNFTAGRIVSNTVIVGVDQDSYLSVFNSAGTTDVVVDVTGWFPQDALGLVADARDMRRYTSGTDKLGLIVCQRTPADAAGPQTDAAAALAKLGDATAYYRWLSGGRYEPQFTYLGTGPYNGSDLPFVPCRPTGASFPDDLRGVVYDVPSTSANGASGLAGPGPRCTSIDCTVRSLWPDNQRAGRITSNTLELQAAPGVTDPWFSVPVHEIGHMLNWPHSYTGTGPVASSCAVRTPDGVCEYDDPTDLMSREPDISPMAPQSKFTDLQATSALNRYAAGWMSPSLVAVHPGGTAQYRLVAKGGGAVEPDGTELLVLPTDDPAAYVTAEARSKAASWDADMARYDGTLQQEGIVIHVVDQRAVVGCPGANVASDAADRCSGLGRRIQQYAARPNSYDHVIAPGQTVTIGAMELSVVAGADGRYDVTVSGGAYPLPPVAHAVVSADVAGERPGESVRPTAPGPAGPTTASPEPGDQVVDASPMPTPAGSDLAERARGVRRRSASS